jgi:hypothetical protein
MSVQIVSRFTCAIVVLVGARRKSRTANFPFFVLRPTSAFCLPHTCSSCHARSPWRHQNGRGPTRMNGSRMHTDRFQGLEPATSSLAILTRQTYRCICTRRKDTLWKSNLAIVEANIADIASNKTLPHRIHWTLPQLTVRIGYPPSPAIIPHGTSQPYSKASLVGFQSLAFAMHLAPSAK